MTTSLARSLLAAPRTTALLSTRPSRRYLHKNPYVEEWTGLREETHKSFTLNSKNALAVAVAAVIFPGVVFFWSRAEELQHNKDKTAFNSPKTNKYV